MCLGEKCRCAFFPFELIFAVDKTTGMKVKYESLNHQWSELFMTIRKILLLTASVAAIAAYGNTTWTPVNTYNTGDQSVGNQALKNMTYWTDGENVGSGAPTADDDFIFDKSSVPRLRINAGTVGTFTGNSLQIGTASQSSTVVQDGGTFTCTNAGLMFKSGNWWFNAGPGSSFLMQSAVTA